jgi:L-fucose mutarotase
VCETNIFVLFSHLQNGLDAIVRLRARVESHEPAMGTSDIRRCKPPYAIVGITEFYPVLLSTNIDNVFYTKRAFMLKTKLLHPEIFEAIASCGHGDKILITDGNYPISSQTNPDTTVVYLALRPGLPTVTDVLETLAEEMNFENAQVMSPGANSAEPAIFPEFRSILGTSGLEQLDRFDFYDSVRSSANIRLAINTGEVRTFANILLTIGVVEQHIE